MKKIILLLFTLGLISCTNNFIELGKTYEVNDAFIIGFRDYQYEHSKVLFTSKTVKLSIGKLDDTYTIESKTFERDTKEGVLRALFILSKDGQESKLEFCRWLDEEHYWLRFYLASYRDEPEFASCSSFIEEGKVYKFDYNTVNDGNTVRRYSEATATFSQNKLTIAVGDIVKDYKIIRASYEKMTEGTTYKAYYNLLIDGEDYVGEFTMADNWRHIDLIISVPSHPSETPFMFIWDH